MRRQPFQSGGDLFEAAAHVGQLAVIHAGGEQAEGSDAAPRSALWRLSWRGRCPGADAAQATPVDKRLGRLPEFVVVVGIEHLHGGGGDQVAPAAQDAGCLRAADRLAAGEGDQIGAGRQMARRFEAGGNSPAASTSTGRPRASALLLRSAAGGAGVMDVEDAGRLRAESRLVLPRLGPRTPEPATGSWKPTSTKRAPAARTAWS